jgi:hypothetical protein
VFDKQILYIQHIHFQLDDEQQQYHVNDIWFEYVLNWNLVYLKYELSIDIKKEKGKSKLPTIRATQLLRIRITCSNAPLRPRLKNVRS